MKYPVATPNQFVQLICHCPFPEQPQANVTRFHRQCPNFSIFWDAQWTNKDRLPDALLRDLIEHFSRLSLGNAVAEADVLGQSYEYLIKKFADATNKKAGGTGAQRR